MSRAAAQRVMPSPGICKKTHSAPKPKTKVSSTDNNHPAKPICKEITKPASSKNQGLSDGPVFQRSTFRTSRAMDFFSRKELVTQTGYSVEQWPLVVINELIDNSLDACEEAGVAPVVDVVANATGITISDNGPGLPQATIEGALDFSVRTSSREMYVAPDRGAQGNALKTLLAMPHVVAPQTGRLLITAHGIEHELICGADPISQEPRVRHRTKPVTDAGGTSIRMEWNPAKNDDGQILWPFEARSPVGPGTNSRPSIRDAAMVLFRGYAVFNPHLSLSVHWFNERLKFKATNSSWAKWKPNRPTSPHWYEQRHLERLAGCYIHLDRQRDTNRTVADFLAEFDGLTGSAKRKRVIDETGLGRTNLSELADESGFKKEVMARLLTSMRKHSRPVKPARLGVIGRDHFCTRFQELGCEADKVEYAKCVSVDAGLPYVLETAFAWFGEQGEGRRRLLFAGANWSPRINNPFRAFGRSGEGLDTILADQRATSDKPVVFAIHATHPRVEFTDRGKTALVMDDSTQEGDE